MQKFDVIVIGAGAAGLMCSIEAGLRQRKTLVIDHANKPGKKIIMSGGGRCNFTNLHIHPSKYLCHNPHFVKSALARYSQWDFIELVKKHQIPHHEKTLGQLFCDNKSKDIVNMLLKECNDANVTIHCSESISQISQIPQGFELKTSHRTYQCESLVVACGGLSIPTMGASPFGYKIAEQFGLKVYPTRAGLVPLTLHTEQKEQFAPISGIAHDCQVTCNKTTFSEAMLFTHRGLSGPAILQISSYWQPGEQIVIDFDPSQSIIVQLEQTQNKQVKNVLAQHMAKRLPELLLPEQILNTPVAQLSKAQKQMVMNTLKAYPIIPNGTEGYRTAEVTLGGVDCNQICSKTFATRSVPNLYFIGEVLDVAGWLGGYNFQWAWSSGWAAGQVA